MNLSFPILHLVDQRSYNFLLLLDDFRYGFCKFLSCDKKLFFELCLDLFVLLYFLLVLNLELAVEFDKLASVFAIFKDFNVPLDNA